MNAAGDKATTEGAGNDPVLEMDGVGVPRFDGLGPLVLTGVNWRIERNEVQVVGGLPGSGKSVLLSAAAGLLRVEMGSVRLFGESLQGRTESELVRIRKRVGLVFSDGGRLFHSLTVAENIALPFRYHGEPSEREVGERVGAWMEATGLGEVAHVTPGRLARHQRPRAALARALILEPELLLLDHPLVGLDWREVRWWLGFLGRLAEGHPLLGGRRLTMAVATHDLRPWLGLGRRFFWVEGGCLAEAGGAEAVGASENAVLRELLAGR